MKIKNKPAWLLGLCCVLCTACFSDALEEGSLQVGDSVPAFTIRMHEGDSLRTSDLLGEVALLVFFNTSCGDCRQELPIVQRIHAQYGSHIRIVGISREEDEASVSAYWKVSGLTFPFSPQQDRKVYALFAKSRIPRIYLVDRTLIIRRVYSDSPLPTYEDLSAAIEALL